MIVLMLSGGSNNVSPEKQDDSSISETRIVQTIQENEIKQQVPVEKSWTKEEIQSLFIKANQNSAHNYTIVDAVAFLDSYGYYQTFGVFAKLCADSDFAILLTQKVI